jgi:hypothetical protein
MKEAKLKVALSLSFFSNRIKRENKAKLVLKMS